MKRTGLVVVVVQNLVWVLPLGFVIYLWEYTASMLFMLIISLLLASVIRPLVSLLEMVIAKRLISTIAVYAGLFLLVGYGLNKLWPIVYDEAVSIQTYFNMETFTELREKSEDLAIGFLPESMHDQTRDVFKGFDTRLNDIWGVVVTNIQSSLSHAGSLAMSVGSILISTLFIIVFSFFFVLEGHLYRKSFVAMIPNAYFEMTLHIMDKATASLGAYIRGQLLAASAIGILSITGLFILQAITPIQIPYTVLIGTVAGVGNLIPFVGPVMGMIPAIIVYLVTEQPDSVQFLHIVFIILTFASVQVLDNLFISPMIMSGSIGLHPMVIIIAVTIGGSIAGPVGMLFSVPILSMVIVIVTELRWGLRRYGHM
ncbi:MAG: AI-2E family transporter [Candidatus Marinimicrobia bacterium]|jgi:predicted PurR-regulated permease PerM|nr:AI-2E family transporter [Candidatus Neomarinimicrobiota bacterium]MBT3634581.1 AI-2E family transporter [Candidatus Neomarinimicrobiota bacterium]MBT3683338.1 AI-2E family transporter [Candidatus Neomarinimicrobiota bacterium]MBT3760235.1 AI-2E family transporter [Candidatus Neomarinimicrobiota bacterium]MBT3896330.1 AI-2E family transporter [Candidatus Neomarinimicrobiota bacterium]